MCTLCAHTFEYGRVRRSATVGAKHSLTCVDVQLARTGEYGEVLLCSDS